MDNYDLPDFDAEDLLAAMDEARGNGEIVRINHPNEKPAASAENDGARRERSVRDNPRDQGAQNAGEKTQAGQWSRRYSIAMHSCEDRERVYIGAMSIWPAG